MPKIEAFLAKTSPQRTSPLAWIASRMVISSCRQFIGMPGLRNGDMGVSGRIGLYVACYVFMLGFDVSSLDLMIFQVGFWGKIWC